MLINLKHQLHRFSISLLKHILRSDRTLPKKRRNKILTYIYLLLCHPKGFQNDEWYPAQFKNTQYDRDFENNMIKNHDTASALEQFINVEEWKSGRTFPLSFSQRRQFNQSSLKLLSKHERYLLSCLIKIKNNVHPCCTTCFHIYII